VEPGRRPARSLSPTVPQPESEPEPEPVPEPVDYFTPIAHLYETYWPELFDPAVVRPAVAFLADHAVGGAALELGVGTGRLALPLHGAGVPVHGIELSPAVAEQLGAQPGSEEIGVTVGDMATARVEGSFSLVYLVRNTIMNLTTQDAQVACFANAARHLRPGGCFVMEVMVPQLRRLPPGETVRAFTLTRTHFGFEEYTDFVAQESWSHHYWVVDGTLHTFSAPFRYVWPSELDLMARLAGLVLRERWSDWDREPFTSESPSHVSVWEKPGLTEQA
jgi:SAM-dependent methyltransferase